jgi:hypothetical protein
MTARYILSEVLRGTVAKVSPRWILAKGVYNVGYWGRGVLEVHGQGVRVLFHLVEGVFARSVIAKIVGHRLVKCKRCLFEQHRRSGTI